MTIGFSGPRRRPRLARRHQLGAQAAAASFPPDVDLQVAEGTNDVNAQIAAIETFINDAST